MGKTHKTTRWLERAAEGSLQLVGGGGLLDRLQRLLRPRRAGTLRASHRHGDQHRRSLQVQELDREREKRRRNCYQFDEQAHAQHRGCVHIGDQPQPCGRPDLGVDLSEARLPRQQRQAYAPL